MFQSLTGLVRQAAERIRRIDPTQAFSAYMMVGGFLVFAGMLITAISLVGFAPYGSPLYFAAPAIFFLGIAMLITAVLFPFMIIGKEGPWLREYRELYPLYVLLILLVLGIDGMFLAMFTGWHSESSWFSGLSVADVWIATVLWYSIGAVLFFYTALYTAKALLAVYRAIMRRVNKS